MRLYLGANENGKKLATSTFHDTSVNTNLTLDGNKHTINYTQTFSTLPSGATNVDFYLKDISTGGAAKAQFKLTLLPATIGMTVSTSTAGYNYNAAGTAITGSYNDKILPYLGPYQLKYGEQLNFSCDKTTKMAVYSSAKNNTLPLLKELSASNNYSSNQILKNRCLYVFICFY